MRGVPERDRDSSKNRGEEYLKEIEIHSPDLKCLLDELLRLSCREKTVLVCGSMRLMRCTVLYALLWRWYCYVCIFARQAICWLRSVVDFYVFFPVIVVLWTLYRRNFSEVNRQAFLALMGLLVGSALGDSLGLLLGRLAGGITRICGVSALMWSSFSVNVFECCACCVCFDSALFSISKYKLLPNAFAIVYGPMYGGSNFALIPCAPKDSCIFLRRTLSPT